MAVRSGITVSFTAISSRVKIIHTRALDNALNKYTKEWCDDMIKQLREYPPPPGGSFSNQKKSRKNTRWKKRGEGQIGGEYIRTNDLKRAWARKPTGGGGRISWAIENMVRDRKHHRYYARLVHGGPDGSGQWWFHANTGWVRVDEAAHEIGGRAGFREGAQFLIEDHIS